MIAIRTRWLFLTTRQEATCAFFLLNRTDFVQIAASLSNGPWKLTQCHSTGRLCWRKSTSTFYFQGHAQWFMELACDQVIQGWSQEPGFESQAGELFLLFPWTLQHTDMRPRLVAAILCQPEGQVRVWNDCRDNERSHGINSTQCPVPSLTSRCPSQWSLLPAILPELDFLFFFFFFWKHWNGKCGDKVLITYSLYICFRSWEVYQPLSTRTSDWALFYWLLTPCPHG